MSAQELAYAIETAVQFAVATCRAGYEDRIARMEAHTAHQNAMMGRAINQVVVQNQTLMAELANVKADYQGLMTEIHNRDDEIEILVAEAKQVKDKEKSDAITKKDHVDGHAELMGELALIKEHLDGLKRKRETSPNHSDDEAEGQSAKKQKTA